MHKAAVHESAAEFWPDALAPEDFSGDSGDIVPPTGLVGGQAVNLPPSTPLESSGQSVPPAVPSRVGWLFLFPCLWVNSRSC